MIRLLLEARDAETGERLDETALRNEAAVIFMAGHETTANSLAWAWYLLSQAPEVEERLHAELAKALGGRPPTLEDVTELLYTRAISAGERRVSREARLYSVQRRPPHLCGRRLRSDRSCPVPRHSGSTGPPALGLRCGR